MTMSAGKYDKVDLSPKCATRGGNSPHQETHCRFITSFGCDLFSKSERWWRQIILPQIPSGSWFPVSNKIDLSRGLKINGCKMYFLLKYIVPF